MKKAIMLVAVVVSGLGCARIYPYVTISSHTIQVAEKQEADVVWIGDVRDDTMLRCHNSPQGPKCVRVQH